MTGTAAAGLLTYTAVTKGFAIAEKAATVINTAFGATLPIISVGMWPVILAALAGAAALLVLTGAFDKASNLILEIAYAYVTWGEVLSKSWGTAKQGKPNPDSKTISLTELGEMLRQYGVYHITLG